MEIKVSCGSGFVNGSVQMIKFAKSDEKPKAFYVAYVGDGSQTLHALKRNWVSQFFQILILRIKYK